jgi:kynurenine formamidase
MTKTTAALMAALTGLVAAVAITLSLREGQPDHSGMFTGTSGEWVELSHAFGPSTIYWPTDTAGFQLTELAYGQTDAGYFYASYSFASAEHGGTHLDAPIHFAEGRLATHEIPLSSLITTASVVDVTASADTDPDYLLSVDDLTAWEAEHGEIAGGTALLIRTGWSSRWNDRTAYLGTDLTGPEAVPALHFPGISPEAAQWIVDNRDIAAIGIDTPSIDYGQSSDYRAHVILYSDNIVGFENLTNLDRLPATGAGIVALPLKIEGGSGGPLRIVGWVPGG